MNETRYSSLCGCVCVACVQLLYGCDSCELLHPELLLEDLLDQEVTGDE